MPANEQIKTQAPQHLAARSEGAWHGVAWHGTSQRWPDLRGGSVGTLGPGLYFTSLPQHAAEYGSQLARCAVRLNRPWRIALSYEDPLCEALDFDHPGLRAITALPGGRLLIERARLRGDLHFDEALQLMVSHKGHDGIVGVYGDGSMELVAWGQSQVSILSWHQAEDFVKSLLRQDGIENDLRCRCS